MIYNPIILGILFSIVSLIGYGSIRCFTPGRTHPSSTIKCLNLAHWDLLCTSCELHPACGKTLRIFLPRDRSVIFVAFCLSLLLRALAGMQRVSFWWIIFTIFCFLIRLAVHGRCSWCSWVCEVTGEWIFLSLQRRLAASVMGLQQRPQADTRWRVRTEETCLIFLHNIFTEYSHLRIS